MEGRLVALKWRRWVLWYVLSGREQTQGDVAVDFRWTVLKSMKRDWKTSENKILVDERPSKCEKL